MSGGKVTRLRSLRRDDRPVLPDHNRYRRIAISADGRFLAAGDDDRGRPSSAVRPSHRFSHGRWTMSGH